MDEHLLEADRVLINTRPCHSQGHIPDLLVPNLEKWCGNIGGLPSMLLPGQWRACHFGMMGISPEYRVHRPFKTVVPASRSAVYPVPGTRHAFTVDVVFVLEQGQRRDMAIVDV